ncbi:MAG TPA: hypothetical protein VF881_04515 [Polyangiaceae bacterium]
MSAPERSGGRSQRPPLPQPWSETSKRRTTSIRPSVSAPNFADLDDEETVTYDARQTPAVSLPALRAECVDALGDDDFEFVPAAKSGVESNMHRIDANQITDDLAPPDSNVRPSRPSQVPSEHLRGSPSNRGERVSASAFLTQSRSAPSESRNGRLRVGMSSNPPQTVPAARRASVEHSLVAKFVFVTILAAVLTFVAMQISIARNLPWLDPRPLLAELWKLIAQKIPWESLPKLPKF